MISLLCSQCGFFGLEKDNARMLCALLLFVEKGAELSRGHDYVLEEQILLLYVPLA